MAFSGNASEARREVELSRIVVLAAVALLAIDVGAAVAQDADAGKKVFARCRACHDVEQAKNKVGPHLVGIVGRTAGSLPDYAYSEPMKAAGAGGLVWDDENIAKYMTDVKGMIPGNKMAFAGLKKPEDIANLIAYLKTFPAN